MANIKISPDTMRTRAGQFNDEAGKIGDVISTMDNLLSQLQEEWEGAASQAYAERYNSELKPSFQKAQQLAEEIASALNQTAQTMEQQDADIASGFRG